MHHFAVSNIDERSWATPDLTDQDLDAMYERMSESISPLWESVLRLFKDPMEGE